jgi:hypothetical protein
MNIEMRDAALDRIIRIAAVAGQGVMCTVRPVFVLCSCGVAYMGK